MIIYRKYWGKVIYLREGQDIKFDDFYNMNTLFGFYFKLIARQNVSPNYLRDTSLEVMAML